NWARGGRGRTRGHPPAAHGPPAAPAAAGGRGPGLRGGIPYWIGQSYGCPACATTKRTPSCSSVLGRSDGATGKAVVRRLHRREESWDADARGGEVRGGSPTNFAKEGGIYQHGRRQGRAV